jgi:hypothetical protein
MRAAGVVSRLSLALGLSAAASAAGAFDSGSEPVYKLLPEIVLAGADVPQTAPGFVTMDQHDGKAVLRWGRLFRITGDIRIYGRFSGQELALPDGDDAALRLARSPNGRFLALTSPGGDSSGAGLQIFSMMGDTPVAALSETDLPSVLTNAACGATDASATGWRIASGPDAPRAELFSASWTSDYVLAATWRIPVVQGTAPVGLKVYKTTFQVMADGHPYLTSCKSADAEAVPVARYTPQRDLVARLRTLTFVRLPVMAEQRSGRRPSMLVSGPGLAFSTMDVGDPVVRTALSESQSYLKVVAAVPPQLAVAARQTAALVRQQPGISASAPLSTFGRFGNAGTINARNRGGEGGGEGGREVGSGG